MTDLRIIAEAAQGYEGKAELAALLVKAAARAGADGIKFQLVYADELATPDYAHYELFRTLEMPDRDWAALAKLARDSGIALYLDIFGERSLKLAQDLGCPGIKVHSTDMANQSLLGEVARSSVPLAMLSTAGCSDAEVREVLALLRGKQLVLLHGFQGYPTPTEANDIARIGSLRRLLDESGGGAIGFADHAPAGDPLRYLLPAAALGAGARLLEKHLTLSSVMKFEDNESALNPDEFADFAARMRECFSALGFNGGPLPAMHAAELEYRTKTRKHVVTARAIARGQVIQPDMIGLRRTSGVGALDDARKVCGRRARGDIAAGIAVTDSMLER